MSQFTYEVCVLLHKKRNPHIFFSYETCAIAPLPAYKSLVAALVSVFLLLTLRPFPLPYKALVMEHDVKFSERENTLTIINTAGVKMSELDTEVAWSRNYLLSSS